MLLFIFPLCKFFESQVQVPMGFLTRPVTADQTHHHAGYHEYADDYEGSFHHASVPCTWPSTRAITTADTNMPAMMYTMSMLQHVYAQPGTERYYYDPEIERSHTSIYATDVGFDRAV